MSKHKKAATSRPSVPSSLIGHKCPSKSCTTDLTDETGHLFWRRAYRNSVKQGHVKGEYYYMTRCNTDFQLIQQASKRREIHNKNRKVAREVETRDGFFASVLNRLRVYLRKKKLEVPTFASTALKFCLAMDNKYPVGVEHRCNCCGVVVLFSMSDELFLSRQASWSRDDLSKEYSLDNLIIICRFCQYSKGASSRDQLYEYLETLLFGVDRTNHQHDEKWAMSTLNAKKKKDNRWNGADSYKLLNGVWVNDQILKQHGCSPLSGVEIHRCTSKHCLLKMSVDRIKNVDKTHTASNCWLTTIGENYSKRGVHKRYTMTNAMWQKTLLHRINTLLTISKDVVSILNSPLKDWLHHPTAHDQLRQREARVKSIMLSDDVDDLKQDTGKLEDKQIPLTKQAMRYSYMNVLPWWKSVLENAQFPPLKNSDGTISNVRAIVKGRHDQDFSSKWFHNIDMFESYRHSVTDTTSILPAQQFRQAIRFFMGKVKYENRKMERKSLGGKGQYTKFPSIQICKDALDVVF